MKETNIKALWNEYRELEEKKALSSTIIRKMIRERSGSELQAIVNLEYSSVFIFVALVVLFAVSTAVNAGDPRFLLVGIGGMLISAAGLLWTVFLLRRINAVDFAEDSFLEVNKSIAEIKKLLRRERLAQFIFIPLFLACVMPVLYRMIHDINVFEEFNRVAFRFVLAYVLVTVATLWFYKYYYFRKLNLVAKEILEVGELESDV